MRIVLDTNVLLISLPRVSRYHKIFDLLVSGGLQLIISHEILLEYEEIIGQKTSKEIAKNLCEFLINSPNVEKIDVFYEWNLINTDPDDNKFIDCAIAGQVRCIVTNDKHFNILKSIDFPKVEVQTADEFLTEIEERIL